MAQAVSLGSRRGNGSVQEVPELHQRLIGTQPLAEVHYSDRYLRSPLSALLLREFLGALAHYAGGLGGQYALHHHHQAGGNGMIPRTPAGLS